MDSNDQSMVPTAPAQVGAAPVSADQYGYIEARIRADAQVRTALALARPRDLDVVRERMLRDAARPGFAAVATWAMPRGGKTLTGPSIRFAEAALRALGNVIVDVTILHEDDTERAGEVTVADLESNQLYRQGFTVAKTIERRKLPPGARQEDIVRARIGADGQTLYILRASDQDVLMTQNSVTSRIIRTLALRLAPGDLVEEALDACDQTRRRQDAQDPAAARKRIADAFGALGVSVGDLKVHLGHPLEQCSPAEMDALRGVYAAIKEGGTTWADVAGTRATESEAGAAPAEKAAAAVRQKLAAKKAAASTPPAAAPPAPVALPARWAVVLALAPGRDPQVVGMAAVDAVIGQGGPTDSGQWTEAEWRIAEDAAKAMASAGGVA